MRILLVLSFIGVSYSLLCGPGFYKWIQEGIEHCRQCPAGCACPGGTIANPATQTICIGCHGGLFSATPGASSCTTCLVGTTTDPLFNVGCDPMNYESPCANFYGPLGYTACRPDPPASNATLGLLQPRKPSGALTVPPQYLSDGSRNRVPPYYDMDDKPMVQQSY